MTRRSGAVGPGERSASAPGDHGLKQTGRLQARRGGGVLLGEAFGLRATDLVGAAGVLLAFLWVLLSPVRSLRSIPAAAPIADGPGSPGDSEDRVAGAS